MRQQETPEPDYPRPHAVRTRREFAQELTVLRERAGLTVRQVAAEVGVQGAHSTIGDWFAARGLPSLASRPLLESVLAVCGVRDAAAVERWIDAWQRVRRAPGRRPAGVEPYRGLAAFQPADAPWFFGREEATARLMAGLAALHEAGGGLLTVVGASGSGKSSLLRAGMIAAIGDLPAPAGRRVELLTPGADPVAAVAGALSADPEALRADPALCAADHARETAEVTGAPLVLVVDQFEELFTACGDEPDRQAFVAALGAAGSPRGGALVVIGLRADFYPRVLRYPPLLAAVQDNQLAVGPMTVPELRRAIVEPAHRASLEVEDGLVELVLRELAPAGGDGAPDAGVLPLLSHALYATWAHAAGGRLTAEDYTATGGIGGAVRASADSVYDKLPEPRRVLARRMFLCLVQFGDDTVDTRRRVPMSRLVTECGDGDVAEVLDQFVGERLLTVDADAVEISHEALLTAWPRLGSWLEDDRAALIMGRRLSDEATRWDADGRDPGGLLRGTRLAAVQHWWHGAGPGVAPGELVARYVAESVGLEQEERRRARQRTRRLRQLVVGLVVLLVLAATATVVAVRGQEEARAERNAAIAGRVVGEANALRATDPGLAAQLALAAYRLTPGPESVGSLLSSTNGPYADRLTGHRDDVMAVAFSGDGTTMVTGSVDGVVKVWDTAERHRPRLAATVDRPEGEVTAVASRAGGPVFATAEHDVITLWDMTDPARPRETAVLRGHEGPIRSLAFSPDDHLLVSGSFDGTVGLWNTGDPEHAGLLTRLTGHTAGVGTVSVSPDGRTVASGSGDGTVRLWDVGDPTAPKPLATITDEGSQFLSTAFSRDGRLLATGAFDQVNAVRLWDVGDPARPVRLAELFGHTNGPIGLAFGPDGHTLASAGYDSTVRLWDLTDPTLRGAPVTLSGHSDVVYTVAFSPDGRTLASAGKDDTVRLWDLDGEVLTGLGSEGQSVTFSPDGRTLAATTFGLTRLWDITGPGAPKPAGTLTGHTNGVVDAAFTPDSRALATASLDFTARLWRVEDPYHPRPLSVVTGHTDNVYAVAVSPDGTLLATGGVDEPNALRLWDISDPAHPRPAGSVRDHPAVSALAFAPQGTHLVATGLDGVVRVWDITDPHHTVRTAVLTGHTNAVDSVVFSAGGTLMATGSADRTVRLWHTSDPAHPRPAATLTGHTGAVDRLGISPDGRMLATPSKDDTVRVWDITDPAAPALTAILTNHTDDVRSATFSADGATLATSSADATVRLWPLDPATAAARVCDRVRAPLSTAEWQRRFPDLPYEPPCR
ncbi:helix-turn-helix domain-containing protein [Actinophytocola oryzae]|uniref:WD40 repeat protein n=1 Tax=Actinophytocola oryzae TaxID=502181 RepID=A0A4R7W129_9PSEU|nr:helix-turn-helix domain-containing protein [Actinophytocola oryzae]TDV56240.1 WD40 repeat protein [Actinophytocola oryzae]